MDSASHFCGARFMRDEMRGFMDRSATQIDDNSNFRKIIDELAGRFEAAWKTVVDAQEGVDISGYLPQGDPRLRAEVLRELIKIDLGERGRRKQLILLEQYLAKFPELGPGSSLPIPLVWEEY